MVLRRMDHSNIALLIAGTYTPLAVALLDPPQSRLLLVVIWSCAAGLVLFRLLWTLAPRWLYTPLYVVMGCLALFYLPQFWQTSPPAAALTAAGGIAYITGAVVYATRRPRLLPEVFSFHEVFHAFTVLGFVLHYVAIMLAMLG
jgi:hemolysin III